MKDTGTLYSVTQGITLTVLVSASYRLYAFN